MTPRSHLTLLCAASIAMLAVAEPALAQAGSAAGSAGPPPAPAEGNADSEAGQPLPRAPQSMAPSGCPYRNGKLELIV